MEGSNDLHLTKFDKLPLSEISSKKNMEEIAKKWPGVRNLIPANKRSKEEHLAITRKGGFAKSPLRSVSQKTRMIRERLMRDKNLSEKDYEWLVKCVQDPEVMATDIMHYISKIEIDMEKSPEDFTIESRQRLASLKNSTFKALHGEKLKVLSTNVNINVDLNSALEMAYNKRKGILQDDTQYDLEEDD